jgi:hypothetical protein
MTFFKAVALALAATSALAAESVKAPVVPGTYIVEFSAGQADTVSNTLQSALMGSPEHWISTHCLQVGLLQQHLSQQD